MKSLNIIFLIDTINSLPNSENSRNKLGDVSSIYLTVLASHRKWASTNINKFIKAKLSKSQSKTKSDRKVGKKAFTRKNATAVSDAGIDFKRQRSNVDQPKVKNMFSQQFTRNTPSSFKSEQVKTVCHTTGASLHNSPNIGNCYYKVKEKPMNSL